MHDHLQWVRWYCSYTLSYRNIEEMMVKRGLNINHSTLNRWVIHYAPKLEKTFRSAQSTLAGIELIAMLNKGQMKKHLVGMLSLAEQLHALAA